MPEQELVTPANSSSEPQITPDDHAEVAAGLDAALSNEALPAEQETPVAQPSVTPEAPKEGEAQKPPAEAPKTNDGKPPVEAKPTPEEKPDAELDAIKTPQNIKNLQGWNALKSLAKQRGERAAALEKEISELKPQVGKPDPKLAEENTTLKAELERYKAIYQTERSPEFLERYDNAIAKQDTVGLELLAKHGLTEETLGEIKKRGGISNVPPDVMSKWIKAVTDVNLEEGEALKKAYLGNRELLKARESEVEKIRQRPQEFEAQQKEATTKQFTEYTAQLKKTVDEYTKDIPWARIQEIPKDATPEVKARLEAENQFYREAEAMFQTYLYPATPQVRAQAALSAVLAHKLAKDNDGLYESVKSLTERNATLEAELGKIKKAGITNNNGMNAPVQKPSKQDKLDMPDDEAVELGLREVGA